MCFSRPALTLARVGVEGPGRIGQDHAVVAGSRRRVGRSPKARAPACQAATSSATGSSDPSTIFAAYSRDHCGVTTTLAM